MADISKVDAFLAVFKLMVSGDEKSYERANKIILDSIEQDKQSNQYSRQILLNREDKKVLTKTK